MGTFFSLLTGPDLYRRFTEPDRAPHIAEAWGSFAISITRDLFSVEMNKLEIQGHFSHWEWIYANAIGFIYFSTSLAFGPVLFYYLYHRGWFTPNAMLGFLQYAGIVLLIGYGGRLFGRALDPTYREFISLWQKARDSGSTQFNSQLKKFDFEIFGVNADFHAVPINTLWHHNPPLPGANPITKALSWYAIHAFGRHMMYPGSMGLLNYMLKGSLKEARQLMVNNKGGKRAWLRTVEGDLIDTIYIEGPQTQAEERQKTLVICCEGNAGYYEIGVANTPGQLGYSVLGWNHPGFGESSGLPFPKNTLAAADAVMQYAKHLGYRDENIVLFGWSIGGFPTSWLAANYPNVKGVILDATFDDVKPLAESRMPKFLSGVVEHAVRAHLNLEIHAILARYKGPLRLIRRLQEEILTIQEGTEDQIRASNRANFLLKEVLRVRHPELIKGLEPQVDIWLTMSPQERLTANSSALNDDVSKRRAKLFAVCEHYLVDFDATHVQPLSPMYSPFKT